MMKRSAAILLVLVGCTVGEDEATDSHVWRQRRQRRRPPRPHRTVTVKASTTIPANRKYTLTTFGGPGDHQSMSCGGYADGTTWYAASRQRYGCGSEAARSTANGKCVVVERARLRSRRLRRERGRQCRSSTCRRRSRTPVRRGGRGLERSRSSSPSTEVADGRRPVRAPPRRSAAADPTAGEHEVHLRDARSRRRRRRVRAVRDDATWYSCDRGRVGREELVDAGCTDGLRRSADSATLGTTVAPRTCVQAALEQHLVPVQRSGLGHAG